MAIQNVIKKNNNNHEIDGSFTYTGRKYSLPMSGLKMEEQVHGIEMMVSSVTNENEDEDHFIILVHGFQASRQDFIILKNCLEIRFKTKVFISTCN